MDIISHYSAGIPYVTAPGANPFNAGSTEVQYASADEYRKMIQELESWKPIPEGSTLYNGSATRAKLSGTEIAVLANKYDVHNMSDNEFDDLLDDLENMGAISEFEKRRLCYKGFVDFDFGDSQAGSLTMWVAPSVPEGSTLLFNRWEADGDISRWINDRIQWERGTWSSDPAEKKKQESCEEVHRVLAGIINRMGSQQKSNAEAAEKAELVRQLADGNSDLYTNMRTQLKAQVEKNDEDRKEQAIIDALAAVLDAMSGREDVSGNKTSVNKSASELTRRIGERINELEPDDPERVRLEQMLKQLQKMGLYFNLSDTDDLWQDEDETFETLTQFLIRRQTEEISTTHPITDEVNESV